MPKQTFFNLPAEKRKQILDIAIDEFAENDYDNASISRIVARAGIAKGSFYQYFEDKDDLYTHLIQLLVEAKTAFLSLDNPDPTHVGIFAYLRWMAVEGVAFQLTYPRLSQIGLRAMSAGSFPPVFRAATRDATMSFYRRLIEVGKLQGDIAPETDTELAAFMFDAILSNLSRYILAMAEETGILAGADRHALFEVPEISKAFTQSIDILERGMGIRDRESSASRPQSEESSLTLSQVQGGE